MAIAGCPVGGTGWYKKSNPLPPCTYHSGLSDTKELDPDDFYDDDFNDNEPIDPEDGTFGILNPPRRSSRRSSDDTEPRQIIDNED